MAYQSTRSTCALWESVEGGGWVEIEIDLSIFIANIISKSLIIFVLAGQVKLELCCNKTRKGDYGEEKERCWS